MDTRSRPAGGHPIRELAGANHETGSRRGRVAEGNRRLSRRQRRRAGGPARRAHSRDVAQVCGSRNRRRTPHLDTAHADAMGRKDRQRSSSDWQWVAYPFAFAGSACVAGPYPPRENTEPVYAPRPDRDQAKALADIEDYEFTNQFSAMGSWKPGLVRRWMGRYILLVIDWTARHWPYTRGRLARVRTIHFARWVYLDGMKRIFFATSYDGSLDSYNDDFINKVSFGLNVTFASGIGYPKTRWLLAGGAKDEQKFKDFLRRHQMPTDVWYNAHPSLTAVELERNSRIRQGLKAAALSDEAAREWVQLL